MFRFLLIPFLFPTLLLAESYKLDPTFPQLPKDIKLAEVSGVTINSAGDIFIFHRGQQPIIAFDKSGKFLRSFGEGTKSAHGLRCDSDDNIWATDVVSHTVTQFAPDGKVLLTLGEKGVAGEDETHFNKPTDIAFAPDGNFFVSDGYGNSRVVKFDKTGKFLLAWGKKGTGEGEFNTPHAVRLDSKGNLYVGDRENDRVQVFDQNGKLLNVWSTELIGPAFFYVDADDVVYIPEHNGGMISILTLDGERLARWGDGPVNRSCHGIWVDSHSDLYVVQPGEWGRVRRVVKYERQ